MGYIPKDVCWFIAELVLEIRVEGDPRIVLHKNLTLVRAASADEAYAHAIDLGAKSESQYENPSGRSVQIAFRGVSKLNVVHDHMEHGAELLYEELVGVSESEIGRLIPSKESLAIFRAIEPSTGPDYSSREILDEATEQIENLDK
jgi:hypothetical protein